MRDRIKEIATELLITHGYRGLRFKDIADRLGTTRANIHYHFGTKKKLIEEVIDEYVDGTTRQVIDIWTDRQTSFIDKTTTMMAFNRQRYDNFNPRGKSGRPWSLISRMRLEAELLSKPSKDVLRDFSIKATDCVTAAVEHAQASGEISPDAPTQDIAVQIVAVIDSAGSITSDAGSFDRLEHLYTAYIHILTHAYGGKKAVKAVAE